MGDLREVYIQAASIIPGWEELSRNDCANGYLKYKEENGKLANAYLSALILKFWNILNRNYYTQTVKIANEFDCHDILIDGILKALDAHVWTDPKNVLYGDPNGPEKAINVCLMSTKINFFNATSRQKRCVNYANASLDKLEEDSSEGFYMPSEDSEDDLQVGFFDNKVKELFKSGEYVVAFVLDGIITFNFFDVENGEFVFNFKQLKHHLKYIDDSYLDIFSKNYNLDLEEVKKAYNEMSILLDSDIDKLVDSAFTLLKQDYKFRRQLSHEGVKKVAIPVRLW